MGHMNAVESFIAYENSPHQMVSREWVITSSRLPFGRPGDSGAFVLNDHHQVIGLYWGLLKTKLPIPPKKYYFTPIGQVFKHIEEITGYQVRLPTIEG